MVFYAKFSNLLDYKENTNQKKYKEFETKF